MNVRMGSWIKTYSGIHFYPQDPRPEDFNIIDIAHSLSNQCRFSGHVRQFYSVSQHSLLVADLVQRSGAGNIEMLSALLHDATEAYLVDVPRPIKPYLKEYKSIEANVAAVIARKFGLIYPWPDSIMWADNVALYTEARDLLPGGTRDWNEPDGETDPSTIYPLTPGNAEMAFKAKYDELTGGNLC